MACAALLAGFALSARRSAAMRGAAAAAGMIALLGAAWQHGGFIESACVGLWRGPPLAFAIDLLLRPGDQRSGRASAVAGIALVAAVVAVYMFFELGGMRYVAIAAGLLVGAAPAAGVERWETRRDDRLPCK